MEQDECFDPVVFVCPYLAFGDENMIHVMDEAYKTFYKDGYKVFKTYDKSKKTWLDIKTFFQPDLVCFTSPWELTRPEFLISNYLKTLTCYVPYGYKISHLYEAHFNRPMQNLVWKFFLETEIHKKLSLKYSQNKSINTVVTGYPGMDRFLKKGERYQDIWKIKDRKIKRIIWDPHHTIPGQGATLDYSTFLKYADFMLELCDKYKNEIQIAFKPHPVLRLNLNHENVWGKNKTDIYFRRWEELSNGQLIEGDYLDLFFTSDAMIHDCGSFLIEYLYTNKPVMYLWNDESIPERFNEIGKIALTKLYQGRKQKDIEDFIENTILGNDDPMKKDRIQFFNKIIKPPKNETASENIYTNIKSSIFLN